MWPTLGMWMGNKDRTKSYCRCVDWDTFEDFVLASRSLEYLCRAVWSRKSQISFSKGCHLGHLGHRDCHSHSHFWLHCGYVCHLWRALVLSEAALGPTTDIQWMIFQYLASESDSMKNLWLWRIQKELRSEKLCSMRNLFICICIVSSCVKSILSSIHILRHCLCEANSQ